MKKSRGKMALHRETVRQLSAQDLPRPAAAGRTDNTCDVSGCLECLPCYDGSSITA